MLRLSKFADYGTQVMAYMAKDGAVHSASEVASGLDMAAATVSKILKMLARENLVASVMGAKGGYMLARPPQDISMAEIINAMDGPISITECSGDSSCTRESLCSTRGNWQVINRIIQGALEKVSLAEMIKPGHQAGKHHVSGQHIVDTSAISRRGKSA
ncbi:MAG: SUF system Fe-S cluster assembly regulator [Nitrosomonadales bacterium]|nr:SUF system Fe-S cluster assembly regulator [Nitrosomonadales bacterium]